MHSESKSKLIQKLKAITKRNRGISYDRLKTELRYAIMGWVNYFHLADMQTFIDATDEWLRAHIRMWIWKKWKRVRTRYTNLKQCGLPHYLALRTANARKGYWRMAHNGSINTALSSDRLYKAGYATLSSYYRQWYLN